jgi:hypothetical protein
MDDCAAIRRLLFVVLEGEAAPGDALRVARHLPDCTACRIVMARERRLGHMLERDLHDLPVGEEFVRSVMATLPAAAPAGRLSRRRRRRGLRLAGLGALLVAGTLAAMANAALPATRATSLRGSALGAVRPGDGLGALLDRVGEAAMAAGGSIPPLALDGPWISSAVLGGLLALPAALGLAALALALALVALGLRARSQRAATR